MFNTAQKHEKQLFSILVPPKEKGKILTFTMGNGNEMLFTWKPNKHSDAWFSLLSKGNMARTKAVSINWIYSNIKRRTLMMHKTLTTECFEATFYLEAASAVADKDRCIGWPDTPLEMPFMVITKHIKRELSFLWHVSRGKLELITGMADQNPGYFWLWQGVQNSKDFPWVDEYTTPCPFMVR